MVNMNRLSKEDRIRVIACLVEGNSIRSTVRMTGVAKNTVAKLLVEVGAACSRYQDFMLRNLPCKRIQCDEIWSFCYAKDKNVPLEMKGKFGVGSVWTWTAICADTKLIPCWMVGTRGIETATEFMNDLASRLKHRVQLTTDGHKVYLNAVDGAFGLDVDYAMLVKLYAADPKPEETRYSPAACIGSKKQAIIGDPNPKHVSTSYAERQNLTMRMSMRRFTRLTNAFSKKVENHAAAVALYMMYYNFVRTHQTLRVTPAMAAGVVERPFEIADIVGLLEEKELARYVE
jgi:IS1 family transposase